MAEKEYKLDLFKDVFPALYRGDHSFYDKLSDEEKKSVTPVTLMRWLTSLKTNMQGYQIGMVNELVNKKYTTLYNEPELMWKLLVASTMDVKANRPPQHEWIAQPKKRNNHSKLEKLILGLKPEFNELELSIFISDITLDDFKQMLSEMGIDDKAIKEYVTDFKKHHNGA